MLIEIPEDKNEYRSVWDKPVPIIEVNKKLYRIYILSEIYEPINYGELIELLQDLDETVTVEWYLNTPGGNLDSTIAIIEEIKKCRAKMVGRLSGTVASAGTMLTMFMDEIEVAPFTSFMIHNYSVGLSGKGKELKTQQAFMEKETARLFKEIYKKFLTPAELKKVLNDQDIWLNKEEVETRWKKKQTS